MSSNVRLFVAALTGILLLVVLLYFWIGSGVAQLAFLDPRRDDPFVVFDFYTSQESQAYADALAEDLGEVESNLVENLRLVYMLEGQRSDQRESLLIWGLQAASDAARVLTDAEYRERVDGPEFVETKLGSYDLFGAPDGGSVRLVVLATSSENEQLDVLRGLRDLFSASQVVDVYRTQPKMLSAAKAWEDMVVLSFRDMKSARAWLNGVDFRTERAILKARSSELMIALYEAQGEVTPPG